MGLESPLAECKEACLPGSSSGGNEVSLLPIDLAVAGATIFEAVHGSRNRRGRLGASCHSGTEGQAELCIFEGVKPGNAYSADELRPRELRRVQDLKVSMVGSWNRAPNASLPGRYLARCAPTT